MKPRKDRLNKRQHDALDRLVKEYGKWKFCEIPYSHQYNIRILVKKLNISLTHVPELWKKSLQEREY